MKSKSIKRLFRDSMAQAAIEALESRTLLAAVKIMPLGDSITESFPGHATYRFYLYNQLAQAGYDVDFVGTMTGATGGAPLYSNFDQNHEGHSGWRTDQIRDNMISFANANKPDIVLLHTGSNDIEQGQSNSSTITEISATIDNLRSVVPNVKILLAQIIPENFNTVQYPALNSMIATLAGQKTTANSPVVLVDQYTGFNNGQDTYDGIHPDESGEKKMSAKWFAALQGVLPAPTPPNVTYLSDLNATSSSNGWGAIEKDLSNGETGTGDGRTLAIQGLGYLKGLGTHAGSDTTYNISGGTYSSFDATVGVDDEVGNPGSVIFQVYVDGVIRYTSPKLTGAMAGQNVSIPLTSNNTTLRLVVTNSGDGSDYDHGDWANARLINGQPIAAPTTPSNLGASYNSGTSKIDLTWTDNASDETGYRIERKTGAGGSYSQIAEIASASVTSYSDGSGLTPGATYYYRVRAYKTGANSNYSNEANAAVPVTPGAAFVSDLPYTVISNGWGPVEKDKSNGENGSGDGRAIALNGTTYTKGLGVHAGSEVLVNLNGQYTQFFSDVGLDDEVGANGSVVFQVYLDGASTPVFDSGKMTGASATQQISISLSGVNSMRLVVTNAGDGGTFDHGDWANARVVAGPAVSSPAIPSDLNAVYNASSSKIDLTWADNASDETGYRIERKTGVNGTYAPLIDLTAGTSSYSDGASLVSGLRYYYRVYAYKTGALNSAFSNEAAADVPIPPGTTYLSDLSFTTVSNGWGVVEKDKSNGEAGAGDGRTITLNAVTYTKGLGVHAGSEILFNLNGLYSQFFSDVGIDDEVNSGSVVFQVYADGAKVFDSGTMLANSVTKSINGLSMVGVQQLRLVVTNNGDGSNFDHADWAGARVVS